MTKPIQIFIGTIILSLIPVKLLQVRLTATLILQIAVVAVSVAAILALLTWRFPGSDLAAERQRGEIDGMIREAVVSIAGGADLSDLTLDVEDRKELLSLFQDEELPTSLRTVILRIKPPTEFPDI